MNLFNAIYRAEKMRHAPGNAFSPRMARLLKQLFITYKKSLVPSDVFLSPLDLFYKRRYDLISTPWDLVIQYTDYQKFHQALPISTLGHHFLNQHDSLLIVGNPGVGKTWVLHQLAQRLAANFLLSRTNKVPIILNLETWQIDRESFWDWGIKQATESYSMERPISQGLFDQNTFIVLLDNFDKLTQKSRERCVEILNEMHQKKEDTRFVLSTRIQPYTQVGQLLEFIDAVEIISLPISAQHQFNRKLADPDFREIVQNDDRVRRLLVTPLSIELMYKAYLDTKHPASDTQEGYSDLLVNRFYSLL